jgi:hypothetical protein
MTILYIGKKEKSTPKFGKMAVFYVFGMDMFVRAKGHF